ncbi:MAG: ATP-binding protein [Deltaproteobacteria bacterium]|nr:ATP-binding protein [Deltaproteobacteria bacterium]
MFKNIFDKIIAYNDNLTVRVRLIMLTVSGLALTMAIWGFIQLTALDRILVDQQVKRLEDAADTISTFYQFFPTKRGLLALDSALKDYVQTDVRLARIDIFDTSHGNVDYVTGASRVQYEWPDNIVATANAKDKVHYVKIETESGPALGLLYPVSGDTKGSHIVVGIIGFSRANAEIMNRAQRLLIFSSIGLLLFILLVLGLSYGWIIGRPLKQIIQTIDEFQKGQYVTRIPIVHLDEWGQISKHFNIMANEIQDVMDRNLELNKHLEDRVREETIKVVQLQKQVTDLKQLTALGQLTANLAHDLGTPLHSIGGLAKLLLEKGGWSPDVRHKLDLIVQQTQRLDNVIQNVRKATRLPEPHFEVLTIKQILSETLPLMESFVQKNNVEMSVNIEGAIKPLYVDRYRIQTAFMNIIQNALEAMPQGGKITVSAQAISPNDFVAITISDTGTGMLSDMIEKVCEPFFSTRQDEGLRGLGLAIVRDIIKVHGGTMEIKSSPGEGTSVILNLPIAQQDNTSRT